MTRDRIKETFASLKKRGKTGLIVFVTVGHPDLATTLKLVPALVEAGADAVELGVPFSDPLAEGPVIQESSFWSLEQGTTLRDCLGVVEELRPQLPDTPLVLMGYYNPIYRFGIPSFSAEAQRVGVDGLIVPDLPHYEFGPLAEECRPRGISVVPMLAPTSTERSIRETAEAASGFIYCVSITGVTGAREEVSQRGFELLDRIRRYTTLPLAVGFGISNRRHVEEVGRSAEAAIVGSALVRVMLESPKNEVISRASQCVAELAGRSHG